MKTILTFFIALVVAVNVSVAQNEGEIAPDFTLKTLSNQDYKLSENRGKVILVFLVGHNCPLCVASSSSVKSKIIDNFKDNSKFEVLVIDTWNGSTSAVQNFKNSSGLDAIFLQNGGTVASSWSISYDKLVVIDAQGKMVFKGTRPAGSDANAAKTAVQNALNSLTTSSTILENSDGFSLGQNFPNPVMDKTTIQFSNGKAVDVKISLVDITGKTIEVLTQQFYQAGNHKIVVDNSKFKRGIYLYRMEAGEYNAVKRMIIQ